MASPWPSPPWQRPCSRPCGHTWPTRPPVRAVSHHRGLLIPPPAGARVAHETTTLRGQSQQNTPLKRTASPTDTVEVTDPTYPLYGLIFLLLGITTKPRLGRVCVVGLYPGVERVILYTATNLGGTPAAPAPCRLSVAGLHALFAVVAMWDSYPQEEAHVDAPCPDDFPQPAAGLPM